MTWQAVRRSTVAVMVGIALAAVAFVSATRANHLEVIVAVLGGFLLGIAAGRRS